MDLGERGAKLAEAYIARLGLELRRGVNKGRVRTRDGRGGEHGKRRGRASRHVAVARSSRSGTNGERPGESMAGDLMSARDS